MYKIASKIYDEDKIHIHFIHNDEIMCNKILNLDFNCDNTPTFADSRHTYDPTLFSKFIDNIKKGVQDVFSFDIEDDNVECGSRYDGIFYHNGAEEMMEKLIVTNAYGKSMMSMHIDLTNCKDIIVADLMILKETIDELIRVRLEYVESLNKDVDEEIKIS